MCRTDIAPRSRAGGRRAPPPRDRACRPRPRPRPRPRRAAPARQGLPDRPRPPGPRDEVARCPGPVAWHRRGVTAAPAGARPREPARAIPRHRATGGATHGRNGKGAGHHLSHQDIVFITDVFGDGGRPWNRTRPGSPRRSYSPLPHLAARRPLARGDSGAPPKRQGGISPPAALALATGAAHCRRPSPGLSMPRRNRTARGETP